MTAGELAREMADRRGTFGKVVARVVAAAGCPVDPHVAAALFAAKLYTEALEARIAALEAQVATLMGGDR